MTSLDQTGDGHFSPIAGYHSERDLVLVLDVARFKYPPYWVPLSSLWAAMSHVDPHTGLTRGYYVISGWDDHVTMEATKENNNTPHHSISQVAPSSMICERSSEILGSPKPTATPPGIGVCPPRIRTWQDVKKDSPSEVCCLKKAVQSPLT